MSGTPEWRRWLLPVPAWIVLAACAGPRLEVATAPAQPSVTLADVGIQLTILPNTWSGYPGDLSRYYTPVEVKIQNDRTDEIQVRYADFLAVDEARNQYRVVPPDEVARALRGSLGPNGDSDWGHHRWAPATTSLLAWNGPWWPYSYRPSGYWYPYYPYYPDPLLLRISIRWARPTAYDILTQGLREGRVLAGARVEGFLYLQQATQKGNLLTLSWTPASAEGQPLATLSSQFRILR